MKKLQIIPLSFGAICVIGSFFYLFSGEDSLVLRLGSVIFFSVVFVLGLWAAKFINLRKNKDE